MSSWLIGEIVLVALLCFALMFKARLGRRFQLVSMATSGLLVALCTTESLVNGARPWTIGLGAIAVVLFAIEFVRQSRQSSG